MSAAPLPADAPAASIVLLAVAVAFHVLGAGLLVVGAPALATVHAFAAFVLLSVIGASQQLVPVLFRTPALNWRFTIGAATGVAIGFAMLIAGFMGAPTFLWAGLALGICGGAWAIVVLARLLAAQVERLAAITMGISIFAFLVAASLGVTMSYDLGSRHSFLSWLPHMHAMLMILLFASLLIIAISYRFVPMFSLSHAQAYGRRLLPLGIAGAALCAVVSPNLRPAFGVAALGMLELAREHLVTLRARLRRKLDLSLIYAAVGWLFALGALLLAAIFGVDARSAPAFLALALLGWISVTIFGYGMKILGFLAWEYARNHSPNAKLAPLSAAIPRASATVALVGLLLGIITLATGEIALPTLIPVGAWLYLVGASTYAFTLLRIAGPYMVAQ